MSGSVQGVFQAGMLRVEAGQTNRVTILKCDDVYRTPAVAVVPVEESFVNFRHTVILYLNGMVSETHNYVALGSRDGTYMRYSDKVFPPNIGWGTKAGLRPLQSFLPGFELSITNNEAEIRSFFVYSSFEKFAGGAFKYAEL